MKFFRQFFFFGLAGTFGFLVDALMLYFLIPFFGLFYARVFSFLTAVLATWVLNRNLAFRTKSSNLSVTREFMSYLGLMLAGGMVNYGIYVWLIVAFHFVFLHPVLGVALGSLAGMTVNFASARFFLYRFQARAKRGF